MELRRMLTPLEHWPSTLSMLAERAAMRKLGLGCTAPVGAYAHFSESRAEVTGEPLLILTVLLMEPVHRSYMKIEKYTSDLTPEGAMKLGQQAIGALIADGGGDMLLKYFNHIHPDYRPHFPHDPNLNN
jgi:hydroxymethylbilane synthase